MKGEYDHMKSNFCYTHSDFESIREELLSYNRQDCLVLHQVICKFSELVFELFKVNIKKIPTISSLALQIYRSNFMPKKAEISITHIDLYDKLISGYFGGSVDVYKPINPLNTKVYCYDVNSLYPAVMMNNDMPLGIPKLVQGHIDIMDKDTFGLS